MSKITPISFPIPEFHPKAWGSETWVINNEKYCLKILKFKAGKSFSNHFHWEKDECWYLSEGQLLMEYYDLSNATILTKTLNAGDTIHIPPGNPHKLSAITDAVIYEVSTTHHEEDSYRIGKGDSQK